MESIEALKKKGNDYYAMSKFEQACKSYGECLEAMIATENAQSNVCISAEFCKLKYVIFLNLALANLKLGAREGCRRCCNAALVFCNNPLLELSDLGVDDDLTQDVALLESLSPAVVPYAAKSLFRRGQSYADDGLFEFATRDLSIAFRLMPSDVAITQLLDELAAETSGKVNKEDAVRIEANISR